MKIGMLDTLIVHKLEMGKEDFIILNLKIKFKQ